MTNEDKINIWHDWTYTRSDRTGDEPDGFCKHCLEWYYTRETTASDIDNFCSEECEEDFHEEWDGEI